ncbi:OmpA family protein [Streptomyces sp. NBC_00525]|uniref:OmpA family protein n=1 Tax=Streptomyces sp. NBC_00525 TaxID=2903660 RepID=UPI002E80F11B|nr:OmpA family protein [Streptomyces sp. NBC_00525]WUC95676.1 OmpA family protein [Streptomyces sp. NBC_00525]
MTPRSAAAFVVVGIVVLGGFGVPQAFADDSPYPSASAEPPVEVDPDDSDLKLPEGATLAPPKVLDIKSVIEDLGGEERREDTNADIKFALQAEVLFGKDSAKLSGEATGRINAIAEEIKKQDARKVRVFGFTDDLGSSEHGDVLSKKRAEAVHNVLDEALGGTGITFEIRGYGEDYPIASNEDEEGRRKNRRVEVSFQRGEPASQS